MRSRGDVDVAQIAAAFGGGGHARAAGFPAPGGVEETIQAIRSALAPAISAGTPAGAPERAGA
jgi:phosphoesterase RecJ-like protein